MHFIDQVGGDQAVGTGLAGIAESNEANIFGQRGGEVVIGDDQVEQPPADVVIKDPDVIVKIEGIGLATLGGDVANVDLNRPADANGVGQIGDEQVGQQAGVQATRTDDEQLGIQDGLDGLGEGRWIGGLKPDMANAPWAERNLALTGNAHIDAVMRQNHIRREANIVER